MGRKRWRDVLLLAVAMSVACATEGGPDADLAADLANGDSGRIVEGLTAQLTVVGQIERSVDTYGFVVEAGQGAVLTVTLGTIADEVPCDTIVQVWGPYEAPSSAGALLGHSDDGVDEALCSASQDGVGAPPLTVAVPRDGRYLIAFSSRNEVLGLPYRLNVSCEGSSDQCRPDVAEELCSASQDWSDQCRHETMVVLTPEIDRDTHWDSCEVILGNSLTVTEGAALSVAPGVRISSEFSGDAPFGDVNLIVEGTLNAEGSEEFPVVFHNRHHNLGWVGLVLNGTGNTLSHTRVSGARIGVQLNVGAEATLSDSIIQGGIVDGAPGVAGVRAAQDVEAEFVRALVRGFERGLWLENARFLFVEDSVIRENGIGVRIDGTAPVSTCDPSDADLPPIEDFVDPVIRHSDIIENEDQGILLNGSDCLIQLEHTNVIANGTGIEVRGVGLHPDSFMRQNNIFMNDGSWQGHQLISYHQAGPMDISENFWGDLSDQELEGCWNSICEAQGGELVVGSVARSPFGDAGPRAENITRTVLVESWYGTDQ